MWNLTRWNLTRRASTHHFGAVMPPGKCRWSGLNYLDCIISSFDEQHTEIYTSSR